MWVYVYVCGYVEKYHICGLKVGVRIICGYPLYVGIYGTRFHLKEISLVSSQHFVVSNLENDPLFEDPPITPSIAEKHALVFRRVRRLFELNLEERWAAITGEAPSPALLGAMTEILYPYDASTNARTGLNFAVCILLYFLE